MKNITNYFLLVHLFQELLFVENLKFLFQILSSNWSISLVVQWALKGSQHGIKVDKGRVIRIKLDRLMNPSTILTLLFSLSAGILASSTGEAIVGPGPDQIRKALDVEKTLRGFKSEKPHGMIMIAGPASSGNETNPFMALFRHRRHHKRHHRRHHKRHRIHRHPVPLIVPHDLMGDTPHPHPNAFLEVMKIRERVVVDEQNRPKSAELALSNDLMQIDPLTGQVKVLRHGEIHIKPKKRLIEGEKSVKHLVKSVGPERSFVVTEFGADGNPLKIPQQGSRLDRFIRFLRLDQFWPLFFFSAACGFTFVALTFLAAKLILGLIDDNERESYETVPTGENLLNSIESAQPIKITSEMIEINENTSLNSERNENESNEDV